MRVARVLYEEIERTLFCAPVVCYAPEFKEARTLKSDDLVFFSIGCLRLFDGNVRLVELEPAGLASCVASCLALLIEALLLLPKGYSTPRPPCAPDPAINSVQVRSLPKEEYRILKEVGRDSIREFSEKVKRGTRTGA